MLIYGKQPVAYAIDHHKDKIKTLFISKDLDQKEFSELHKLGIELKRIPHEAAQKMTKNANHQGFFCEMEEIELSDSSLYANSNFILVLSALSDVGNIGALVRSAYALGVDGIVITGLKNIQLAPIVRTSTGALLDMPIIVHTNIHDVLNELSMAEYSLYAADMDGQDIREATFKGRRALILGAEGEGISPRTLKKIENRVSISMKNNFDSLNVSVAGAILMDRMR